MDLDSLVVKTLRKLGFQPLARRHPNANGPDVVAIKHGLSYRIEIKATRVTKRGSLQVSPVENARRSDELIAIVLPGGYVLIEPMADHFRACTPKGYRTLTVLA